MITQSHVWHFRAGSAADFQQPEARQGGRESGGVGGVRGRRGQKSNVFITVQQWRKQGIAHTHCVWSDRCSSDYLLLEQLQRARAHAHTHAALLLYSPHCAAAVRQAPTARRVSCQPSSHNCIFALRHHTGTLTQFNSPSVFKWHGCCFQLLRAGGGGRDYLTYPQFSQAVCHRCVTANVHTSRLSFSRRGMSFGDFGWWRKLCALFMWQSCLISVSSALRSPSLSNTQQGKID